MPDIKKTLDSFKDIEDKVYDLVHNQWLNKSENSPDFIFIFSRAFFDDSKKDVYKILSDKSIRILFDRIDREHGDLVEDAKENFTDNQLKSIILNLDKISISLYNRSAVGMPYGLAKLIYKILEVDHNDHILNPYARFGNLLIENEENYPKTKITAVDEFTYDFLVLKIRASIISPKLENISIIQNNYTNSRLDDIDYNKIISLPPWGDLKFLKKIEDPKILDFYNKNSIDKINEWVYIIKSILDDKSEKTAFCIHSKLLFSSRKDNIKIRKYLVENGFLEAVVELSNRLINGTGIKFFILVISKNNKSVKMIDASDNFTEYRSCNKLEDKDIENILDSYYKEGHKSKNVSYKDLKDQDFNFLPKRYTSKYLEIENFAYLKDLAKIKRGYANIRQKELDKRLIQDESNIKFLTASDLKEDFDIDNLSNLDRLEEKEESYLVQNEDIVFVRGGNYKTQLINPKDKKILANGSLYIIDVDKEKIDPYYLQLYLSSDHCQNQLNALNSGTRVSFMGVSQLGELKIPRAAKEVEEKLVGNYKNILKKYEIIKLQKKQLEEEEKDIINEVLWYGQKYYNSWSHIKDNQ